jgi:hypothetical protein
MRVFCACVFDETHPLGVQWCCDGRQTAHQATPSPSLAKGPHWKSTEVRPETSVFAVEDELFVARQKILELEKKVENMKLENSFGTYFH